MSTKFVSDPSVLKQVQDIEDQIKKISELQDDLIPTKEAAKENYKVLNANYVETLTHSKIGSVSKDQLAALKGKLAKAKEELGDQEALVEGYQNARANLQKKQNILLCELWQAEAAVLAPEITDLKNQFLALRKQMGAVVCQYHSKYRRWSSLHQSLAGHGKSNEIKHPEELRTNDPEVSITAGMLSGEKHWN